MRRHDETIPSRERRESQRRFQWLATLPLLLVVLLVVVEGGRVLYAWARLHDIALAAAQYTSSGAYDIERYPIDEVVPCVPGDERGEREVYDPSPAEGDEINVYSGGVESVFATWYGGLNCTPGDPFDEALRVDMVRLLSVINHARSEAVGLTITSSGLRPPPYGETFAEQPWYRVWEQPQLGEFAPGWFNVVVCSSRPALNVNNADEKSIATRFTTYLDRLGFSSHPEAPICVLSEADAGENAGKPWLDAGGPGDLVTIVVQYNFPLLLPLGVGTEAYVRLETYASLTNADFRPENLISATLTPIPDTSASVVPSPTGTATPSASQRAVRVTQPSGTSSSTGTVSPDVQTLSPTSTPIAPTLAPRDSADGC